MTVAETGLREPGQDFIRDIVAADLAEGRHRSVITRFPPEPNGYLHIGHAKSICLNFGVAQEFGGRCHLRFDDTNPTKEEQEYIDAIERDVRWLGFDWGKHLYHASDYFEQLYAWAEHLIKAGKAYIDDQSQEEMRASRGTLTEPGTNSPWRNRSVEENLDLFRRMRAGEFPNGARVLRARIDMASGNINLRDPVLYRILHATHPRTGTQWKHLPELRLRARPVGRHRAHHALDLHAGVRGPSPALRLVHREPARAVAAAPVRVRAPEHDLHGAVQARADGAGAGRARLGLGRSAHAHDCGPASARRAAGGDPRFRQAHRRRQGQQRGRCRHVRVHRARGAQQRRAEAHGRAAAAQGGDRELPGGQDGGAGSRQQPGGRKRRLAQDPLLARAVGRARRLHGEPAQEVLSACRRARRCGCATPTSSRAGRP